MPGSTKTSRPRRPGLKRGLTLGSCLALTTALVGLPASAADDPAPVLVPTPIVDSQVPEQSAAVVASRIQKLATDKMMGKKAGTIVIDPGSQETLYNDDAGAALIPASSMKIPTAVAVLRQLGANTRISTTTALKPNSTDLFIIGGGDPLLDSGQFKKDPASPGYPETTSMNALAKKTSAQLQERGVTEITLKFDASLFTGPDWNPDWPTYFRGQGIVSPVQALMVDDAQLARFGSRGENPAAMAGNRFAELLSKTGIKVGAVNAGTAPADAEQLADVKSVPVYELVGQMLSTSDNDTAEALFRLAGVGAGTGGSFQGGARAESQALQDLGISTVMANFSDGSGLSKDNRVSPVMLAEILARVVRAEDELWPISSGLAVAGVSGTLKGRFATVQTQKAAGLVRAKTGTLISVSSLSGFVQSRSGRVLVFATVANEADSSFEAATVMDRIAATIAACGCQ